MTQNYYGLLSEKYGKWGFTKKERIFIFNQEGISYYPVPEDQDIHNTLSSLKQDLITNNKKGQNLLTTASISNEDIKEKFPKEKKKGRK